MSTFVYKKSGPNPYRIKFDDPDWNTDCCVANPENGPKRYIFDIFSKLLTFLAKL